MKRLFIIGMLILLSCLVAVDVFSGAVQARMKKIVKATVLPYFGARTEKVSKTGYDEARRQLKRIDGASRFDAGIKLSEKEEEANRKFVALRDRQIEKYRAAHNFPPSDYFYKFKPVIEADPVFKVIQSMPKGGVLHVHSTALAGPDWIIAKALATPNCYVCWDKDLCSGIKSAPVFGQLEIFPGNPDKGYRPIGQLRQSEPDFMDRFRRLLIVDKEDEDLADIWVEFENLFSRNDDFLSYEPIFRDYLKEGLETLIRDKVQVLEMRGGACFFDPNDPAKKCDRGVKEKFLSTVMDVYHEVQQTHPEFKMKFIIASYRGHIGDCKMSHVNSLTDLKKWWHDKDFMDGAHRFLAGYDLVGEEDVGCPTYEYLDAWLALRNEGYDIPFFFHDGESVWPDDENLYDAYLLASKRIGHGFNLFRFPAVLEGVIAADIPLEVSPISNQLLRYVRDLRMHPAAEYLSRGVPIVISSDDPGLFDYTGLSYDFWEAAMAWRLDLRALKKLSSNSITYSSLDAGEKKEAFAYWSAQWDAFIENLNLSETGMRIPGTR